MMLIKKKAEKIHLKEDREAIKKMKKNSPKIFHISILGWKSCKNWQKIDYFWNNNFFCFKELMNK